MDRVFKNLIYNLSICYTNNPGLISALSSEIKLLSNLTIEDINLKKTQLLILLYGITLYNGQFGFNTLLSDFLNNAINGIFKNVDLDKFNSLFDNELNQTLLTCAKFDKLFSSNIKLKINPKPWMCSNTYDFTQSTTTYQTVTNLQPILQRDDSDCFISSKSKDGGFVLSRLDKYSEEFLKYAILSKSNVLNVGSGYGILERISLLLGSKAKMYCNDVCEDHLQLIKSLTPENYQNSIKLVPGFFPNNLHLPNKYFDLVGIFRVLHFMNPDILVTSIIKANNLLVDGGHLILSAETPFLGNWAKFIPVYEQNVINKKLWPGYIENTSDYETEGYKNKLPKSMHFLDVNTLIRVLSENGFEVLTCSTFSRASSFPKPLQLDGKESVGAIAKKVKHI